MAGTRDPYLDQVREIVLGALAGYAVTVYLFGSRASGRTRRASDVDVALDPHEPLPARLISDLREALEESSVPYEVDIVDLSTADDALRHRVRQEGLVWNAFTSV